MSSLAALLAAKASNKGRGAHTMTSRTLESDSAADKEGGEGGIPAGDEGTTAGTGGGSPTSPNEPSASSPIINAGPAPRPGEGWKPAEKKVDSEKQKEAAEEKEMFEVKDTLREQLFRKERKLRHLMFVGAQAGRSLRSVVMPYSGPRYANTNRLCLRSWSMVSRPNLDMNYYFPPEIQPIHQPLVDPTAADQQQQQFSREESKEATQDNDDSQRGVSHAAITGEEEEENGEEAAAAAAIVTPHAELNREDSKSTTAGYSPTSPSSPGQFDSSTNGGGGGMSRNARLVAQAAANSKIKGNVYVMAPSAAIGFDNPYEEPLLPPPFFYEDYDPLFEYLYRELLNLWNLEDVASSNVNITINFGICCLAATNMLRFQHLGCETVSIMQKVEQEGSISNYFISDTHPILRRAVKEVDFDARSLKPEHRIQLSVYSKEKNSYVTVNAKLVTRDRLPGETGKKYRFELQSLETAGVKSVWTIVGFSERLEEDDEEDSDVSSDEEEETSEEDDSADGENNNNSGDDDAATTIKGGKKGSRSSNMTGINCRLTPDGEIDLFGERRVSGWMAKKGREPYQHGMPFELTFHSNGEKSKQNPCVPFANCVLQAVADVYGSLSDMIVPPIDFSKEGADGGGVGDSSTNAEGGNSAVPKELQEPTPAEGRGALPDASEVTAPQLMDFIKDQIRPRFVELVEQYDQRIQEDMLNQQEEEEEGENNAQEAGEERPWQQQHNQPLPLGVQIESPIRPHVFETAEYSIDKIKIESVYLNKVQGLVVEESTTAVFDYSQTTKQVSAPTAIDGDEIGGGDGYGVGGDDGTATVTTTFLAEPQLELLPRNVLSLREVKIKLPVEGFKSNEANLELFRKMGSLTKYIVQSSRDIRDNDIRDARQAYHERKVKEMEEEREEGGDGGEGHDGNGAEQPKEEGGEEEEGCSNPNSPTSATPGKTSGPSSPTEHRRRNNNNTNTNRSRYGRSDEDGPDKERRRSPTAGGVPEFPKKTSSSSSKKQSSSSRKKQEDNDEHDDDQKKQTKKKKSFYDEIPDEDYYGQEHNIPAPAGGSRGGGAKRSATQPQRKFNNSGRTGGGGGGGRGGQNFEERGRGRGTSRGSGNESSYRTRTAGGTSGRGRSTTARGGGASSYDDEGTSSSRKTYSRRPMAKKKE